MPCSAFTEVGIPVRVFNSPKSCQSFPNHFICSGIRAFSIEAKSANGLGQSAEPLLVLATIKDDFKFTKFMAKSMSQGLRIGFFDSPP
mmetsp:Transcript_12346/g.35301  ORF Transcript_12346/g.35301 Transcript_12346/m.35301 type:complete len:88 (+) Transcript_12346:191-454(+)